jgi:hypothetical protein
VLLSRIDAAMERIVRSLRHPDDAAQSLADLILRSIDLVHGDDVNEALFSADSGWLVISLEFGAEPVVDRFHQHLGPLLDRWQADGQLYADLDLRETTRWINAFSNLLLAPPLLERSSRAKRAFIERYLLRALIQG